jgi:hypothetical protein
MEYLSNHQMKLPIYYNKTFSKGRNDSLNACVGINGIQDHEKYGYGFDEATKLLIKAVKSDDTAIDAIIYPLIFCARHRLELFLKDQLLKFPLIRENNEVTEHLLSKTHNLETLWDLFKRVGETTDRRILAFIDEAEEYILDFAEIDPTGETFRYPYDQYKTTHLINTPLINIGVFENRYSKLSTMIDRFESLTKYLIDEYAQKTFTSELSRADIYQISRMLPHKKEWMRASFDSMKAKIRKKFNLSNRKLSKVIDVIKIHREFCTNIGLELPITQMDSDVLKKYLSIYKRIQIKRIQNVRKLAAYWLHYQRRTKGRLIEEFEAELSREAVICIFTLIELGKLAYYGEAFDSLYLRYEHDAAEEYEFSQYCYSITASSRALEFLINGLTKIGQKSLLKCILNDSGKVT